MSVEASAFTQTVSSPGQVTMPSPAPVKEPIAKVPPVAEPVKPAEGAAVEPPKEEPKKEDPASKRFAMLARNEQKIQKQSADLKTREANLVAREEALTRMESVKKEVALNPKKALEYFGVSYEDLTNFILKGEKPTPEMQVRAVDDKLEAWKKQQEEDRQQVASAQSNKAKEENAIVIQEFREGVTEFCKTEAGTYELIALYGLAPVVIDTIEEHFSKTGKILSTKEAADLVEAHYEQELDKVIQTKKFKAKVAPPAPKAPEEPPTPAPSRTINNAMTTTTPTTKAAMSDEERFQRAMSKLQK